MLVVYEKPSGMITQVIVYAEPGLQRMKEVYDDLGKGTLIDPEASMNDAMTCYVLNETRVPRPVVDVVEPEDMTAAELIFQVNQPCQLQVTFGAEVVATEMLEPGPLTFEVAHSGLYQLRFSAEFPFADALFNLEVQ